MMLQDNNQHWGGGMWLDTKPPWSWLISTNSIFLSVIFLSYHNDLSTIATFYLLKNDKLMSFLLSVYSYITGVEHQQNNLVPDITYVIADIMSHSLTASLFTLFLEVTWQLVMLPRNHKLQHLPSLDFAMVEEVTDFQTPFKNT